MKIRIIHTEANSNNKAIWFNKDPTRNIYNLGIPTLFVGGSVWYGLESLLFCYFIFIVAVWDNTRAHMNNELLETINLSKVQKDAI